MNQEAKILELEAKVSALTGLVERLTALVPPQALEVAAGPAPSVVASEVASEVVPSVGAETEAPTARASRRGLLKLAGAAAAGTAVAVVANAAPAAADDPNDITMGATKSYGGTGTTTFEYTSATAPTVPSGILGGTAPTNLFTVRDEPNPGPIIVLGSNSRSTYPAAVGGYSYRTVANGVYGFTSNAGYGLVGYATDAAGVGALARGAKANLELYAAGTAPNTRTDAHLKGEVIADTDGNVWMCVAAGSPGTWRKVAGTTTAGSLHLLAAPKRVYDTRPTEPPTAIGPKTPMPDGTRTIDCTGNSSGVPTSATGVVLNVTALTLSANGFLSVSPGATGFSGTSTLNWTASGAQVANGVTVATGANATIDVTIGGGGNANIIVDVMGYYL